MNSYRQHVCPGEGLGTLTAGTFVQGEGVAAALPASLSGKFGLRQEYWELFPPVGAPARVLGTLSTGASGPLKGPRCPKGAWEAL